MKRCLFILIISLPGILGIQCKKDSGTTDPGGPLTEQEKQAIIQTYGTIAVSADSLLKRDDPVAAWQSMLATYRAASNVENAWVSNDALYVKFKKSGTVSWYVGPGVNTPPYGRPATILPKGMNKSGVAHSTSGVTTVCLINQLDRDETRNSYAGYFSSLKRAFEQSGFTVTTKNGGQADVNFFKTGLKQFGVIFLIAHGEYQADGGGITWVNTGEELVGTDDQNLGQLLLRFESDFNAQRISIGVHKETRGGQERTVSYYKISNLFIESSYAVNDFPNSLIYLSTCQSMKDANREMAKTFVRKGAGGVIGWNEKHSIGPHTGNLLFDLMLCGKKLFSAIQALPRESKSENYQGVPADLTYYPNAAGELRLVEDRRATFALVRPLKDSTYTTRNLTLQGSVIADSIRDGILEVNGVATTLTILGDHKSFSQPIVLKNGPNTIHISSCATLPGGTRAVADTTITVTGNFSPLDLWTELRWNTDASDVDFHLLPPGSSFPASFWTTTDCYYGNRTPSWGGFLDVDDQNGKGPEHITIPTVTSQGVYRLFLHYYATHGAGATSAYVTVSVRSGPNVEFGPFAISRAATRGGDIWEICTITYPAGTITPVKVKTSSAALDKPGAFNDKDTSRKKR